MFVVQGDDGVGSCVDIAIDQLSRDQLACSRAAVPSGIQSDLFKHAQ